MTLSEVNDRLRMLGWDDLELDDHTLQLIIANFEVFGAIGQEEAGRLQESATIEEIDF